MYERYTQSITDYLLSLIIPALNKAKQDGYESGFLREWKQRWNNHKLIVTGLSKLFMYLDRFYTPVSQHSTQHTLTPPTSTQPVHCSPLLSRVWLLRTPTASSR